jgi:hypothetical protein
VLEVSRICRSRLRGFWPGVYITYIPLPEGVAKAFQTPYIRYSSETPTFYQNYLAMSECTKLAMSNTADVTGKPIAVWSQSISGVNINPLVAFYYIRGRKREVPFFYFVPDTRQININCVCLIWVWESLCELASRSIRPAFDRGSQAMFAKPLNDWQKNIISSALSAEPSTSSYAFMTSSSYPYPTRWGRYNMFFIMLW